MTFLGLKHGVCKVLIKWWFNNMWVQVLVFIWYSDICAEMWARQSSWNVRNKVNIHIWLTAWEDITANWFSPFHIVHIPTLSRKSITPKRLTSIWWQVSKLSSRHPKQFGWGITLTAVLLHSDFVHSPKILTYNLETSKVFSKYYENNLNHV